MFDVTFDCRLDADGRDPDSHSPTLRRSHQLLWSKSLPGGKLFHLDISGPKPFLVHRSELGEFHLTSDSITHRLANRPVCRSFIQQLPDYLRSFAESGAWPVNECIVFPGKRLVGRNTINGERGMNARIGDRFDLTLECIRRHYSSEPSPLAEVLARYSNFFDLFESFGGYVDFFLLQDLVDEGKGSVKFYMPFDDFKSSPFPQDLGSYERYLHGVAEFSNSRAKRMRSGFDCNSKSMEVEPDGRVVAPPV